MDSDQAKKTEKKQKSPRSEIVELHPTKPDITEHKKAEEAVRRSKQQWETTFNAMSDWVVLIDLKSRIIRTNRAGENFTGKPLAEIIGQSCCKLVHGSEEHIPGCPLVKMLETSKRASAELHFPDTDRWLMVSTDPVSNEEGNIVGAVHITCDITERKKAEKTIRDSEERYKYLFEQSPLGIGLVTADGKVVRINKTMEVMTGYFEVELKKINLADIYENPQDRKKLLETIERYGCVVDFPARLKRKDGTIYDALLNVSRVHLGGQELFQTICMDITERKRAEEALRESEERYRSIYDTAASLIVSIDTSGVIRDCNARIMDILGYEKDEIIGQSIVKIIHPDYMEKAQGCLNEMLVKGVAHNKEYKMVRKDNQIIDVEVNAAGIKEGGGKFVGGVCIIEDISERKRAEEAVRESEEKYRTLSHNIPGFIYKGRPDWSTEVVSGSEDVCGYSVQDFSSKKIHWLDIVYADDREQLSNQSLELAQEPLDIVQEYRIIDKAGNIRWIEDHKTSVFTDEGKFQGVDGVAFDITERKRAEVALRESEEKYRQLVSTTTDSVMLFDAETRNILDVNKACEELYGYSREEFLNLRQNDITAEQEKSEETIQQVVNGELKRIPLRYHRKKDGTVFPVEISGSMFELAGRKVLCGVIRDITERKRAEDAVRREKQTLEDVANSVGCGLWLIDKKGRVIYANPLVEEWFGSFAEIGGKSCCEVLGISTECCAGLDAMHTGKVCRSRVFVKVVGEAEKYFYLVASPVKDESGNIEHVIEVIMDVTEHRKAEEQIKKLARFPAENPNPVLRISARGTVVYANEASLPLLKLWQCRVNGSVSGCWYDFVLDALSSGQGQQTEVQCDGQTFSLVFAPVMDANYVNVYGLDITERKRAERKLFDYHEQLKSLASQMTLTEEQERRRIATDLHDNITQSLSMSKLKLDLVRDSKPSSSADFDEVLNETSRNIEHIIQEVRTLTFDLSSPILYELGFEAAVAEWLTVRIQTEHGIATEFEDDGQPKPLDDDTRTVLFRDVRELLTNVVKHAKAKKVKVSIRKVGSRIHVIVEDDGRGFDPEKVAATAAKAGEFGLFSIRERLKQLGGNIEIESASGHGTRVILVAPLKSES